MTEYKRTLEDELDWSLLDQLHKVVLQTSIFCFRTKQICLTIDVAVIGVLIKLSEENLDTSIFLAGFLIPISFWYLDSIGYFYQVKLRGVMNNIRDRIENRSKESIVVTSNSVVIETHRVSTPKIKRIGNAFFNHSMWLYAILATTDVFLYCSYLMGAIK